MKYAKPVFVILIAVIWASGAAAQPVGIGTTKRGAAGQIAAAIAKVVSEKSGLQMRTQPMAGTQQYIPVVNAGRLEFGVANIVQTTLAVQGKLLSEGKPNPNLRLAGVLFPFRVAPFVRKDSGINSIRDLRGKAVPSGFNPQPLAMLILSAYLANGGLTFQDVVSVPVSGFVAQWNSFNQGRVVVATAAPGQGILNEIDVKTGGIRFLSLEDSSSTLTAMRKFLPGSFIAPVKPAKGLVGVLGPINALAFDYVLFAGKGVSDETVYKVVKAIYDSESDLKTTGPLWRRYSPSRLSKDVGLEYHPGAIKLFKEKGIWSAR